MVYSGLTYVICLVIFKWYVIGNVNVKEM